ncbi:O-methylsterigmatocystin oxidoreductase [Coprinopsis marcescibilis]|uniref:O-methylsterigmatocystin oxidoreductase n=1 Tax=Coprinopsis marcescibilis TaxID=230819 RepID=A0A5C3KIR4_COPMA|nr:O-methylsterigmatocystin oxidoreductase [Coprinopsis marcescibilis]
MDSTLWVDLQWKWPIAAGLAIGVLAANRVLTSKRKRLPLPPGPTGLPVVGNLFHLPQAKPWLVYNDWAKQYGDVMYVNAMGQGIIVLNTLPAVLALMDKRAVNNSDRGDLTTFDMLDFRYAFSFMQYGNRWRVHRRAFHQFLNQNQAPTYLPIVEEECLIYLRNLARNQGHLFKDTRTYFGTVLMRVSYGVSDFEYNKQLIEDGEAVVERFMVTTVPGRMLVNVFPILRYVPDWFPGTAWKKYLKEGAVINRRLRARPYYDAKARLANPEKDKYPSMVKGLIERLGSEDDPEYEDRETVAMNVSAMSFLAGADTTFSATISLVAAMLKHPEVQRKAQTEIDAVTGGDRLPVPEDMADLPYVEAIVKEAMRWFTVAPMGVPHQSTEDEEFNGYFIPKKSLIVPNSWAILHDPEVYEDPHEFKPERFLKDGKIHHSVLDPGVAAFGFGRRICPGRHLSNAVLPFTMACMLSVFDIRPAKDKNGNEIPVVLDQTSDVVTSFKPYQCEITPRSTKHAALLA